MKTKQKLTVMENDDTSNGKCCMVSALVQSSATLAAARGQTPWKPNDWEQGTCILAMLQI